MPAVLAIVVGGTARLAQAINAQFTGVAIFVALALRLPRAVGRAVGRTVARTVAGTVAGTVVGAVGAVLIGATVGIKRNAAVGLNGLAAAASPVFSSTDERGFSKAPHALNEKIRRMKATLAKKSDSFKAPGPLKEKMAEAYHISSSSTLVFHI